MRTGRERRSPARTSSGRGLGVGRDPLDEAGQDLARADLDERRRRRRRSCAPRRATQSTPAVRWSTSSARRPRRRGSPGVGIGGAAAVGSRNSTSARTVRIAVGRLGHERRVRGDAHRQHDGALRAELLRDLGGASMAARSPDTTTWPGVAVGTRIRRGAGRPRRARAARRRRGRGSRPSPLATLAPSACIRRPRSRTSRTPTARNSALAATSALYWPIERPAQNSVRHIQLARAPSLAQRGEVRRSTSQAAPAARSRCRSSSSAGPSQREPARWAPRAPRRLRRRRRRRRGRRPRGPGPFPPTVNPGRGTRRRRLPPPPERGCSR